MTDLAIYQGDDYGAVVAVTDAAGEPANLTGYVARAEIRRDVADLSVLVCPIQATINGSDIALNIPRAVTATLSGLYRWDLELLSADDVVTTLLSGSVLVTQEVTRIA